MAERNHSIATEFILSGFTDLPALQVPLFMLFLGVYSITVVWNLGMYLLIRVDFRLHTPMYFFLSHLSFVDVCYSSAITPRLLSDLLAEKKVISYGGCLAQFYFFVLFGTTEGFLLAAMAYDRYMAICNPLLYMASMNSRVCLQLVVGCYLAGIINTTVHTGTMLRLSFCASNVIKHFYCEGPPLYTISCTDTTINETVIFAFVSFVIVVTVSTIVTSYTYILATILRIHSAEGRYKAFSTCTSHLMAVTLFYGSIAFMYLQPSSRHSQDLDKVASVFYTVVIPLLNPVIYSLRNKEVKDALRRLMRRQVSFTCK
ncbi:olfactory receptor-like protein COR4 [Alligator sinensis]|uniref:Olfactory receptor n=1 Tax=Alligator sinensis TaxID=38654 RepID=A0A1U7SFQ8_ALLSI|nr:olfactory receptor-like protein COR4 [Alligator sinensis]